MVGAMSNVASSISLGLALPFLAYWQPWLVLLSGGIVITAEGLRLASARAGLR